MTKLQMLKPRLATSNISRVAVIAAGSWRTEGAGGTARGYGYKWQKARERYLRDHPLCCYCERDGRTSAATVVDHKVPHRGSEAIFWDESNWQSLCKPCHDGEKAKEEARDGHR